MNEADIPIELLTDLGSTVEPADKVWSDVHLGDVWRRTKITQLQHQLRLIDLNTISLVSSR